MASIKTMPKLSATGTRKDGDISRGVIARLVGLTDKADELNAVGDAMAPGVLLELVGQRALAANQNLEVRHFGTSRRQEPPPPPGAN